MKQKRRPTLAVWKFASCDGCQLTLLDCEDELLALTGLVDIANFKEASRAVAKGPYDLSLVEGSITTPHDEERIHHIRRLSGKLVTIGACATAGGIQALRNWGNIEEFLSAVYATPATISALANADEVKRPNDREKDPRNAPAPDLFSPARPANDDHAADSDPLPACACSPALGESARSAALAP